jgi:hypothetical protein
MDLLTLLVVVLLVLWLTGTFVVPIGGSVIHLLLVIVLVIVVVRLVRGHAV